MFCDLLLIVVGYSVVEWEALPRYVIRYIRSPLYRWR